MSDPNQMIDHLRRQLDAELDRKGSLDQRTVTVLSVGTAAIAVAFSLTQATGSNRLTVDRYQWLVGTALLLFAAAVGLALLSSLATYARGPAIDDLERDIDLDDAAAIVAIKQDHLNELRARRNSNNVRSVFLLLAQLTEVAAISGLGYVVWMTVR